MTNDKHLEYLDSLRMWAIVGVVLIHTATPLLNMNWGKNAEYWWIGNIFDSMVRFAVPLFLMLSGATLIRPKYNLKEFFLRRFSRVFVPFLFWIVVYFLFRWIVLKSWHPITFPAIISWAENLFLKEGVSKHFWYIYMLLFLYPVIPFVGEWLYRQKQLILLIILACWVALCWFTREVPLNAYSWNGSFDNKLFGYLLYLGYIIFGFYLSRLKIKSESTPIFAAIVYLITILISALGTGWLSTSAGKTDISLQSYLSINTMIQTTAVFLYFKGLNFENKPSHIRQLLSQYSYGIYLVHVLILGVLWNLKITWMLGYPLFTVPAIVILTLLISTVVIYILRNIPGGKYISG